MLSIHHFSSRFCNDSLVFSAQKFEIVTSKGRKVTDDKSAFMPRTDGVRPMYRWRLHMKRSATFPTANRIVCGIVALCLCFLFVSANFVSAPFRTATFVFNTYVNIPISLSHTRIYNKVYHSYCSSPPQTRWKGDYCRLIFRGVCMEAGIAILS